VLALAGELEGIEVEVRDVGEGPSWAYDPAAVERLARAAVAGATAGEHDGVVVTHGTDTLEETMFLTWLLGGAAASERCPIVFTGAMRRSDHPAPDGPANLRQAFRLAAGGGRPGPVVAMAGEVHHARWVRKVDTTALDTFAAEASGGPAPPPDGDRIDGRVAEVHCHTGVSARLVDEALDAGARGLVVVGTGAGNVHGSLRPGIERALAHDVPVVVTSRCWTGPVLPEYGGDLGGWTLDALGLDPSPAAVRAWFATLVGR